LEALRGVPKNARDQALIEVMVGCGLRVSEACNLTLDHILWSHDPPALCVLDGRRRVVPMPLNVQETLRAWLEERGTKGRPYVCGNLRTGQRISRKTVWALLKDYGQRAGIWHVHPYRLRHTFGTHLADQGTPIEQIQKWMGYATLQTPLKYIIVSAQRQKRAPKKLPDFPFSEADWQQTPVAVQALVMALWKEVQPLRAQAFTPDSEPLPYPLTPRRQPAFSRRQIVGRREEIRKLQANLDRGISTLLVGPEGVGKRHLLEQLQGDRILRVERLKPVKPALLEIAEALHQHGVFMADPLPPAPGEDFERIKRRHARTRISGWTQMILNSVEEEEWVLVVEDLSDWSPGVGQLITRLREQFVILAALTEVARTAEGYLWRFDRIPLGNLPPSESRELLRQGAFGADVDDYPMFERYVINQSRGHPQTLIEIVNRLRREGPITREAVKEGDRSDAQGTDAE